MSTADVQNVRRLKISMKEIQFKIPELNDLPPERRGAVLQSCLSSDEFSRGKRRIRSISLVAAIIAAIATINILTWSGLVRGSALVGFTSVGTVVIFVVLMIYSEM